MLTATKPHFLGCFLLAPFSPYFSTVPIIALNQDVRSTVVKKVLWSMVNMVMEVAD